MNIRPKTMFFKETSTVPNSELALLFYPKIVPNPEKLGPEYYEELFMRNGWRPAWRWQIFTHTHYHPNTHECVATVYGSAKIMLGGDGGKIAELARGDVVVIPAGVGHRQVFATDDFLLVGAYPGNLLPKVFGAEESLMAEARDEIAKVKIPDKDPVNGDSGGLLDLWKKSARGK